MKIIKTNNFQKLSDDYMDYPPVPKKERGPGSNLFKDDHESIDDIKKKWKKKKKHKK